MDEKVLLKKEGYKGYIIINRPEKLNAIDMDIYRLINKYLVDLDEDDNIRVVILKGEGKAFSAGWDVSCTEHHDMIGTRYINEHICNDNRWKIWKLRKPVIAQVHKYCLGGACELVLPCDYVYISEDCQIGEPEIQFGDQPCWLEIPWLVNMRKATELLLTGEKISGKEAAECGLVTKAFPEDRLEAEVEALADKLITISPPCMMNQKRGLHMVYEIQGMNAAITQWENMMLWPRVQETEEVKRFNNAVDLVGVGRAMKWKDNYFGRAAKSGVDPAGKWDDEFVDKVKEIRAGHADDRKAANAEIDAYLTKEKENI